MFKNLTHILFERHDDATEFGRGNKRLKQAFLSTLSSVVAKLISLIVIFVTVRWGLDYLGEERYGLWMTITTMVALIGIADFGINNSLVNLTSDASGRTDDCSTRVGISNAIVGLSIVSILIIFAIIFANITLSWENVFNLKNDLSINEAGSAILIFFVIFAFSQPLTVAQKILIGLQNGWIANIWIAFGQLAGVVCLWISIKYESGLPILILALMGPQLIINLLGSMIFFRVNKRFIPKVNDISKKSLKTIFFSGGLFFLLQIMSLAGGASDNLIIARVLGADSVSEFSVVQKLATIFGVSQLFIVPLWPAFGEAISRGDYRWAHLTFKKAILITLLIAVVAGIVLVSAGQWIIAKWTSGMIFPDQILLVGFSIFLVVASLGGCFSTLLNNPIFLRKQALVFTFASIVAILLKIIFIETYQSASGAIWGTVIGYSFFFIIPMAVVVTNFFKEKVTPI